MDAAPTVVRVLTNDNPALGADMQTCFVNPAVVVREQEAQYAWFTAH
jgi:hypothetical protein